MKQLPNIWKTDLKRCFSLFGLWLNDPRLRGLGSQDQWPEAWTLGTRWGLSQYPKRTGHLDEMMMTNVRQFQIPRFPNDKRFQTKLCAEVVNSVSKLWVTQKDGYGVWFVGLPCSTAIAL